MPRQEKITPSDRQADLLMQMPVEHIPHGCHIPIDWFLTHRRPIPIYLELGAGTGEKADELREALRSVAGALVVVSDINAEAVEQAEERGFIGFTVDARTFLQERFSYSSLVNIELLPHVYCEGLLSNQPGHDWRKILFTVDLNLMPEGYFFLADIGRADRPNQALKAYFGTAEAYNRYQEGWLRRYAANQEAAKQLGLSIGEREFIVAQPGDRKERELGGPEELTALHNSPDFERWAQHLDLEEVQECLTSLGLTLLGHEDQVFYSRNGQPLPGFVEIWQKGPRFKYSPLHTGETLEEAELTSQKGNYLNFEELRERFEHNLANNARE